MEEEAISAAGLFLEKEAAESSRKLPLRSC